MACPRQPRGPPGPHDHSSGHTQWGAWGFGAGAPVQGEVLGTEGWGQERTPGRRTCGGTCARLSWTWSLALELQLGTMVKGPLLWESEVHSGCGSLPSLPPSPHCTSRGCGSSPADLLALQLPVEADGRPTLGSQPQVLQALPPAAVAGLSCSSGLLSSSQMSWISFGCRTSTYAFNMCETFSSLPPLFSQTRSYSSIICVYKFLSSIILSIAMILHFFKMKVLLIYKFVLVLGVQHSNSFSDSFPT